VHFDNNTVGRGAALVIVAVTFFMAAPMHPLCEAIVAVDVRAAERAESSINEHPNVAVRTYLLGGDSFKN